MGKSGRGRLRKPSVDENRSHRQLAVTARSSLLPLLALSFLEPSLYLPCAFENAADPVRTVLIGGIGSDRGSGSNGDDVLIGSVTNADDDDDARIALLAAWNGDDSYDDRVSAVDAALTVDDDEEEDKLTGSWDQDLFYDGIGDILTDVKTNKDVETVL